MALEYRKLENERELLMFGALLHDIGKLYQRGQANYTSKNHRVWGSLFIAKNFGCLKNCLQSSHEYLPLLSEYHHQPDELSVQPKANLDENTLNRLSFLLKILRHADGLSAGERKKEDRADVEIPNDKSIINQPLKSIFSTLTLNGKTKCEPHFYPVKTLSDFAGLMPENDISGIYPKGTENLTSSYFALIKHLEDDLRRLNPAYTTEKMYMAVESILECNTKLVPSAVYKHEPDIPLFDHLKTTAAIALCIYDHLTNYPDEKEFAYQKGMHLFSNSQTNKMFVILRGELSGIQKYIYNVAEPQQSQKGSAKRLRGRSAKLILILDSIANHIIESLRLPSSNILFMGGGSFEVILPNTSLCRKFLPELKKEIQQIMFREFGDSLSLNLAQLEVNDDMLTCGNTDSSYKKARVLLSAQASRSKNNPFCEIISDDGFFRDIVMPVKINDSCPICLKTRNNRLCKSCEDDMNFGENIPYSRYLVRSLKKGREIMYHRYVFCDNPPDDLSDYIFAINEKPDYKSQISTYYLGQYAYGMNEGRVAEFEELARGKGVERIGVIKLDVDNLGKLFRDAIPPDLYSISRVNTLSTFLNMFFTNRINRICSDEKYSKSYILYAGGDDLVVIANWEQALFLAHKINEDFRNYTCNNEAVTVSTGIYICNPKFPISRAVHYADICLENSKHSSVNDIKVKDSVTVFETTVRQEAFKNLLAFGKQLDMQKENKQISSGCVYMLIKEWHNSFGNARNPEELMKLKKTVKKHVPLIFYILSRTVEKTIRDDLIESLFNKGYFENILIPASYASLANRTAKEDI